MREIRFKVWDAESKRISVVLSIKWHHMNLVEVNGNGVPVSTDNLMQYTGLKDKNGVEIYEGDIITDGEGTALVKYVAEVCAFTVNLEGIGWGIITKVYEVIGNIYENKELLEAK